MLIPSPVFAPSGPDTGCATKQEFRAETRKVMHQPELKGGDKLRRLVRCAKAPKAARHYLSRWRAWRRLHRVLLASRREWQGYRRYAARLPYDCGSGGRWAIPCYIVECESEPDYSWASYNRSGAAGPYQIMPEWGRPWPVASAADRKAHHQIASAIWAGGSGASNWVCA